jgi:hypothetical protein
VAGRGRGKASTTRRSDREAAGRGGETSGGFIEGRRKLRSGREDSGGLEHSEETAAEWSCRGHGDHRAKEGTGEEVTRLG